MWTDTDDQARVRDPAVELFLSHTATLTDERAAAGGPVDNSACASAGSDRGRVVPSDRTGVRPARLSDLSAIVGGGAVVRIAVGSWIERLVATPGTYAQLSSAVAPGCSLGPSSW
jgi:hypothetical protein